MYTQITKCMSGFFGGVCCLIYWSSCSWKKKWWAWEDSLALDKLKVSKCSYICLLHQPPPTKMHYFFSPILCWSFPFSLGFSKFVFQLLSDFIIIIQNDEDYSICVQNEWDFNFVIFSDLCVNAGTDLRLLNAFCEMWL